MLLLFLHCAIFFSTHLIHSFRSYACSFACAKSADCWLLLKVNFEAVRSTYFCCMLHFKYCIGAILSKILTEKAKSFCSLLYHVVFWFRFFLFGCLEGCQLMFVFADILMLSQKFLLLNLSSPIDFNRVLFCFEWRWEGEWWWVGSRSWPTKSDFFRADWREQSSCFVSVLPPCKNTAYTSIWPHQRLVGKLLVFDLETNHIPAN